MIILRLVIYGYIVYQTFLTNFWIALGMGMCFIALEIIYILLRYLKGEINALTFAQNQVTNTDFGFSSDAITPDEADLVDQIREGDLTAASKFLAGRCQNKLLDFKLLPETIILTLAQRLVNSINRGEKTTWKELLNKDEEPNKV